MTSFNKEDMLSIPPIPPAPFDKAVAKYRKMNPGMKYLPYNLNLKERARKLRKNMTRAERKFWHELLSKDKMDGLRFLRQKPIGQYIPDFYCSALMLAIEIDGDSHFSDQAREYDNIRTSQLEKLGIKVIRYTNKEVLENIDSVYIDLKHRIKLRRNELN